MKSGTDKKHFNFMAGGPRARLRALAGSRDGAPGRGRGQSPPPPRNLVNFAVTRKAIFMFRKQHDHYLFMLFAIQN